MNILIIGSEGFIGKHCIRFFTRQGYKVVGVDLLDLKEVDYSYYKISRLFPDFKFLFKQENFNACINAGGSGSVPISIERPLNDFEANTIDVFNLLETIRTTNTDCKYLNISSAAVYGNPTSLPIGEEDAIKPLSPYGWHKYYGELICNEYADLHQIKTCSIRPFSVYGPGLKKQLFWDLYKKSQLSDIIELFGTGNETRDFIYIDDLLEAMLYVLTKSDMCGEVYNVASGNETQIKQAAELFFQHLNLSPTIVFNGKTKNGDPLNWRADLKKINKLGFVSQTHISDGLQKVTQWLREKT